MEASLLIKLAPYALVGFGVLTGIGGTKKYYSKSKDNGHSNWNGKDERRAVPTVTRRECELTHKGIGTALQEGNRRMSGIENQVRTLNDNILKHFDK